MISKLRKDRKLSKIAYLVVAFVTVLAYFSFAPKAYAGTLTNAQVIELGGASNANPMIVSDGQSLAIAFTTVGSVGTNWSTTITFPSGFTVAGTQTISNTGCTSLTGASAGLPGTLSASGSGQVITISSSGGSNSLSASTSYCTELTSTSAVTNPSSANSYSITINDSVDSEIVSVDVLSSGGSAYTVSATVNPTFTMSLSGTTDSLGTLSSSTTATSTGVTTTINTNAADGWFVWAEDYHNALNQSGLYSVSANHVVASVTPGTAYTFTSHTNAENYGIGVNTDYATNYAYNSGTTGSGLSYSAYNELATSGTTASNVQFVTHELANISATTPAGTDYSDTITEIGAGSF